MRDRPGPKPPDRLLYRHLLRRTSRVGGDPGKWRGAAEALTADELAAHFMRAPLVELESSWVAIVVEALADARDRGETPVREMALALPVVADRLYAARRETAVA